MSSGLTGKRVTFTAVLRVREFRVLWLADSQSAIGDQIARVALSVLVFERTSSAILTALTYALTFLPALVGGALLSGLADRLPRRRVLIVADLIRAVLFGLMALPRVPIWVLCTLLVLAVLTESPFTAAESSLVPTILQDDYYVVGTALRTITNQVAQLAGFAAGGIAIAAIGARAGLAVDAATFLVSALVIWIGVKARPAAVREEPSEKVGGFGGSSLATGIRLIFGDPRLRTLLGLAWLAGLYVVPEGVAAPYAAAVGHGATAVGLLMAAMPAGTALGTYLFVRLVPAGSRSKWMGPMGTAAGLPLIGCWMLPNLQLSLVLWAASGLFFSYQVQVVTEFVRAVPDNQRGQAVGIASSGLLAVQGIGLLLGGIVAGTAGVGWAVGGAGLVGLMLALWLTWLWSKANPASTAAPLVTSGGQHRRRAQYVRKAQ
ncbi:MAG: MFS transporter [Actinomycetota bacterium]|nr:MFS transporter [Actinomycetota bacterium]MDQ2956056.1 MFS transporter [Actinomycetota bacterium]